MRRFRAAAALGVVLTALCLPAATGALDQDRLVGAELELPARVVQKHAKLDSALARLARAKPGGRFVQVEAVARSGRRAELEAAIRAVGGSTSGRYGPLLEARLPARALETLAAHAAARRLRTPPRPHPQLVGEGIAEIGAGPWHSAMTTGAGVEIAIVDIGFQGWQQLADADLPEAQVVTKNFCEDFPFDGDDHGTAVAELVHDVAPAAKLHLICVDTPTSLGEAKEYVVANDIPIVNHSVGWLNVSRGDGSGGAGTPDAIVADARAQGVLWVNAAGNFAQEHWSGTFFDPDLDDENDDFHDFQGDDEALDVFLLEGGCVFLRWDDWPTSNQDFDLYLFRSSDDTLVSVDGLGLQNGTQEPTESACADEEDSYYVGIRRDAATEAPQFDLFVADGLLLEHSVPAGSLIEPATSPHVLAVGAFCVHTDGLQAFSSRGPTIDSRTKPDLAGPDAVSTVTYGQGIPPDCEAGFAGTSAATPHIAGAAALLKQANPGFGPAELQAALEARTGPPVGKNNDVGAGIFSLGGAPPLPPAAPTNSELPTVSGLFNQGQTLTAGDGEWTGAPIAFSFRWLRCNTSGGACVGIAGARAKTYVATAADVGHALKVRVTASNGGGSSQVVSAGTPQIGPPFQAPANVMTPSLAGLAQFGQTLSASSGAWSGSAPLTITIEWLRCDAGGEACLVIPGAGGTSYQLGLESIGMTIRIRVTTSNPGGSATARSPATTAVLPPAPGLVSLPAIAGAPMEGQTLTASPGTWTFASTLRFQWRRCAADGTCTDIPGATSATYAPGVADYGFRLQIVVTATNAAGSNSAASGLTPAVLRFMVHAVPPPQPQPPGPDGVDLQTRLVLLRFTRTPQSPRAGRRFTLLVRVGLRATSSRGATRRVSCSARIGRKALRAVTKHIRGGSARCTWAIPKAAAGKRLRSAIVVSDGTRSIRRSITARIRRARLR
jgi:subtilisin family serine protease